MILAMLISSLICAENVALIGDSFAANAVEHLNLVDENTVSIPYPEARWSLSELIEEVDGLALGDYTLVVVLAGAHDLMRDKAGKEKRIVLAVALKEKINARVIWIDTQDMRMEAVSKGWNSDPIGHLNAEGYKILFSRIGILNKEPETVAQVGTVMSGIVTTESLNNPTPPTIGEVTITMPIVIDRKVTFSAFTENRFWEADANIYILMSCSDMQCCETP